jgi:phage host-nuclease inhibitor protein Gam
MAREKKQIIAGVTREQMEEAFARFAVADARIRRINATIDIEVARIREKNADNLAGYQNEKDVAFDVMMSYATENRAELFARRKSIETAHGTLGFRTGTPKLKTRKGFTWAAVLELLRDKGRDYVRITEEVAKDRLLSDRDQPEVAELLPSVGLVVDQDEAFYVEPKQEE